MRSSSSRLPPDSGVVSPIAPADEPLDPDVTAEIEEVRNRLPAWRPGQVADPVQRVRNILYVAAVPDVFQLPVERHLAARRLRAASGGRAQGGSDQDPLLDRDASDGRRRQRGGRSARRRPEDRGPSDIEQARERVMLYALKLLGRVLGKIPG